MTAPETLVFETSAIDIYGGDTVLVQRSTVVPGAVAFVQISEDARRTGSNGTSAAYLTLDEVLALRDQLTTIAIVELNREHDRLARAGIRFTPIS